MTEPVPAPSSSNDRFSIQQSIRTALAAGLAYWLTVILQMPGGYWAAISAIVVMQSEVGATVTASRDRLAGTAIGAILGWMTALIWHKSILIFVLGVLIAMLLCTALRLQNAGRLGGVTIAIIVLIPHTGPVWHLAIERFLEVSFGIFVSLAIALAWTHIAKTMKAHKR